jgi:hypothetical protein
MFAAFAASLCLISMPQITNLRPPAIPLIAHDPYFSIWCPSETLNAVETEHWTHAPQHLTITATIDGNAFKLLGKATSDHPALKQTNLQIQPTQVITTFAEKGVEINLNFLSATISTDLDLLSQPLSYIIWDVKSTDGKSHKVEVQISANGMTAASRPEQELTSTKQQLGDLTALKFGTAAQPVLEHQGDRTQIDWGHLYLAGKNSDLAASKFTGKTGGDLNATLEFTKLITSSKPKSQYAILAYDDDYSIQYFGQNLRAFWRRKGGTVESLVESAPKNLAKHQKACNAFDQELMADFMTIGGSKYTQLACLAYRQCIAGSKLAADPNGQPLWFPKENSSNGCIATSDVIYPMSPQALLFGPALTKALIEPIMAYGTSSRWPFPFAPHDLGTYPKANGQVYGGGERTEENQMPVEESANMLILVAALAHMEGNASYAKIYWPTLTKWAHYLVEKGLDPENQLCTDDFLGHQAHNVNLSAKAIMGIRAYAELAAMLGKADDATAYKTTAENFASQWIKKSDDNGHSRLTFDKSNSWSQKYNLVWDRILGYDLFPRTIATNEMANYRKNLNPFGLPLDSRGTGAKLDWSIWIATLTQNPEDFEAIMAGVYNYVDKTPNRIGLGDWYDTSNGKLNFFEARPVVGGALIPFMYQPELWTKWASRSKNKVTKYAPIPPKPIVTTIIPTADTEAQTWQYTTTKPQSSWEKAEFNDSAWKSGKSGFGTKGTPGAIVNTEWNTNDIWIRREFTLASLNKSTQLWLHHDDDVEVYINGKLAFKRTGWTSKYEDFVFDTKLLKAGKNIIAIHCHQNQGGQYIDAGFVTVEPGK